ncbi:MAG: hypothetical protein WBV36_06810 [Terriglobales bacterium]
MNSALVEFVGTITTVGTVTAEVLLDRFTLSPPPGAAELRVTVQTSVLAPVMVRLLQDSKLNATEPRPVVPVPLKLIAVVPAVEELLTIVSCPVAIPAATGSNCTFKV